MGRLVRIAIVALAVACSSRREAAPAPAPAETRSREVINLRAFARLYGVVRWFHPSDEAAGVEWNGFAVRGVAAVRGAADRAALERALEALVEPFAAGVVIGTADELARTPALAAAPAGAELVAWQHLGPGFDQRVGDGPYRSVRTARPPLFAEPFAARPEPGETAVVELGDGLRARVPIALASVDGHTVPRATGRAPAPAAGAPAAGPSDGAAAIADVIVAWNALAHFYPYLDVIEADWHRTLDDALAAAIAAGGDAEAGREALRDLIVAAEDGHGYVAGGELRAPLPLVLELVDGEVVVAASADAAVRPGDAIVSVDGVPAAAALAAARARQSGSPQWREHRSLGALGAGRDGSEATLELRRAGVPVAAVVTRGAPPPSHTYPPIGELEAGLWLVDLSRAEMAAIDAKLDALAAARCVIFDMRGYPNATHGVLAHLLDEPEHDRWMHVAHVLRPSLPGQPRPAHDWSSFGWDLAPKAPRLRGKVVFMTGPGAISYAESVMGYVEALGLPIVGAATAGTNGNVRQVALPSGTSFYFTGMKVTRHDGARSHLEGIRPTVPVSRTIAGVTAGRDEVLERARWCMHEP